MLEHCGNSANADMHSSECTAKELKNTCEDSFSNEDKDEKSDAGGMFINFSSDMSDSGFKTRRKYKRAYKVNGVNILNR
jgi:hypothetical protein